MNEFEKYASMDRGINPLTLGRYNAVVTTAKQSFLLPRFHRKIIPRTGMGKRYSVRTV